MIEIVFAIAAVICLVGLFLANPFGRGTMKPWLNLVAIVLIATPGVISLVSAFRPFLATDPFAGEATIQRATSAAPDVDRAGHFLVRAFHVLHGDERHPLLFVSQVVRRGETMRCVLPGSAKLSMRVIARGSDHPERQGQVVTRLSYECDGWARDAGGELALTSARPALPGESFPVFATRVSNIGSDRAPIGALQRSGRHDASVLVFVQPLGAAGDVESIRAEGWWKRHEDDIVSRFRALTDEYFQRSGHGSSWEVGGDVISGVAVLVLFIALLLFLSNSTHWVRVVCVFILFANLYVGAIDRAVLRLRLQALSFESERTQAAAIVDAAGSRFHPVTAAERLVEVAADARRAEEVREAAVGMLSTPNLVPHLRRVGGDKVIKELVDDRSERLRKAARRVEKKLRDLEEAAQTRAERPRTTQGRSTVRGVPRRRGADGGTRRGPRSGPRTGPTSGPRSGPKTAASPSAEPRTERGTRGGE